MIRFRIQQLKTCSSTNSLLAKSAAEGISEGAVLVTDYQSGGRGKPGRKWISPAGKNLLFSVLLRPPVAVHRAPFMTQVACRSVAHVLAEHYGIDCQFKRPNDLMVHAKKICGVLTEASTVGRKLDYVIVGIGLNVNAVGPDLLKGSTSVFKERGKTYNRQVLLKRILNQLRKDMSSFYDHTA